MIGWMDFFSLLKEYGYKKCHFHCVHYAQKTQFVLIKLNGNKMSN